MACSLVFHVLELYTYHRRDEETHARIGDTEDKIYDADDAVTVVRAEAGFEGTVIRDAGPPLAHPPHTHHLREAAGGGGNHRSEKLHRQHGATDEPQYGKGAHPVLRHLLGSKVR